MTESDHATFRLWFDTIASLFYRGPKDTENRSRMAGAYFSALEPYPAADVFRGFEGLRDNWPSGKGMPSPSDWKAALPRQGSNRSLAELTPREVIDVQYAEDEAYQGECCHCADCTEANVTHQPIRYVPRLDASGELMKRRHPRTGLEKLLGEWIHGQRLRNWYDERGKFYEKFHEIGETKKMPTAYVSDPNDESRLVTTEEAVQIDGRAARAKRMKPELVKR